MVIAVAAALALPEQEAHAQGAAFYSEIDEGHQPLISEVLNRLQNETADRISIFEDGNMVITWTENITAVAPDGRVFEIDEETQITAPHNFTIENGYVYRDGTIFKPDGTELFASE